MVVIDRIPDQETADWTSVTPACTLTVSSCLSVSFSGELWTLWLLDSAEHADQVSHSDFPLSSLIHNDLGLTMDVSIKKGLCAYRIKRSCRVICFPKHFNIGTSHVIALENESMVVPVLWTSSGLIQMYQGTVLIPCGITAALTEFIWCVMSKETLSLSVERVFFFICRTHMQDLKDVTNNVHYENFRSQKLADVTCNGGDNKNKGALTK